MNNRNFPKATSMSLFAGLLCMPAAYYSCMTGFQIGNSTIYNFAVPGIAFGIAAVPLGMPMPLGKRAAFAAISALCAVGLSAVLGVIAYNFQNMADANALRTAVMSAAGFLAVGMAYVLLFAAVPLRGRHVAQLALAGMTVSIVPLFFGYAFLLGLESTIVRKLLQVGMLAIFPIWQWGLAKYLGKFELRRSG